MGRYYGFASRVRWASRGLAVGTRQRRAVDRVGVRLGRSFEAFKSRWFQSIQVGTDRHAVRLDPLPFAQEQIEDRLRDLCLALNARDYFDISEPIVNVIRVELPAKARRMYRDMEREMFLALDCGKSVFQEFYHDFNY